MNIRKFILTLGFTALLAISASAQSKIGTIDLRKVFDDYYKTKAADANLKEKAGELDKERKNLMDQYGKTRDDYKKSLDGANDQAVSADEREKRKKTAESKLLEIKELEQTIDQFDRQSRTTLEEQQRRMRDNILKEIQVVITTKAKAANYSLVLDTASESFNKTPILLYTNGENDITPMVLKELNQSAPASPIGTK
ncbi:MAG: hlpA [Verrucomicrobiales bacterium]|nr:hlpA [Verrucomicrobiales bacterium]